MSNKDIEKRHHKTFEELKHLAEGNAEFWYARDLQVPLDYSSWTKFKRVILKAITACENTGQTPDNHFSQVGKMVKLGSGSQREIEDYQLSRYACYLIVQNGDPSKPVIANGQTYFAIQTRRQEINLLKQLADKYKTQKRGLMQKMLTGIWRVKPEIVNQYMEV